VLYFPPSFHHHHHHISAMELGHLLTRSGLTYPEISSKVHHDSFCQLVSSVSLPWVIYFEASYLHVVTIFSCIPAICPKLVLFLTPLQFVHLFFNLSKCILLFSCISSLLANLKERSQDFLPHIISRGYKVSVASVAPPRKFVMSTMAVLQIAGN